MPSKKKSKPLSRTAWLKARRAGIGASDAAAVCGLTPWSTPLEVYMDKVGLKPDIEMTLTMKLGIRLEPVITTLYEEATQQKLIIPAQCQHSKDYPFIMANPDRSTADGETNVQIKTAGFKTEDWGPTGSDLVPEQYLVQVQHEMFVTGQRKTDLVVLFGNRALDVYPIPYRQDIIDSLIEIEVEFWTEFVEKKIPPEPDWGHPTTVKLLAQLYELDDDKKTVEVDPDFVTDVLMQVNAYKEWGERMTSMTKERDSFKARLLALMEDAAVMHVGEEFTLTRKMIQRSAYSVEATEYMDFRVKKFKKKKEK